MTGHSQVIVTLAWANNPTLSGFTTQNLAFIWFSKLNPRPIVSCMVMTTLHTSSIPPWKLYMLFFTRKDRYHTLLILPSLNGHSYPSHQFCFFHFPSCFWAQHFKQPSNYRRASVLRCWTSACHDHTQLYRPYKLGLHNSKMVYLHAIWMKNVVTICPLPPSVCEAGNQGPKTGAFLRGWI